MSIGAPPLRVPAPHRDERRNPGKSRAGSSPGSGPVLERGILVGIPQLHLAAPGTGGAPSTAVGHLVVEQLYRRADRVVVVKDPGHEAEHRGGAPQPAAPHDVLGASWVDTWSAGGEQQPDDRGPGRVRLWPAAKLDIKTELGRAKQGAIVAGVVLGSLALSGLAIVLILLMV